jgi:hypothetical protein
MPMKKSTNSAGENIAIYFMQTGSQYYTMARFAMHAQCMPVCGNLFHHAVEMLLKGGLARKRTLSDLRDMGHKLKVLWRAFKADFPNPTLKRHDKTISDLDKFEDIRYPNPIKVPSMGVSAQWSGPAGTIKTYGGLKTPKQYALVVSPIDDLVADVFKFASWYPASATFLGRTNPAALEAITRHNAHSDRRHASSSARAGWRCSATFHRLAARAPTVIADPSNRRRARAGPDHRPVQHRPRH